MARYVVYENDTATSNQFGYSDRDLRYIMVTDINEGINAEEEGGTIINGYRVGREYALEEVELFCVAEDGVYPTDAAPDTLNSGQTYKIQKGDIIRVLTDSAGEYVTDVELFFRLDGENQRWPDGKRGFLAGTIGYFDPDVDCGRRYNPWTYEANLADNGFNGLRDDPIQSAGNFRAAYGYVYNYQEGLIYYTTQNIIEEGFDPDDERYMAEQWIPYGQIVTFTKEGKKYTVESGMNNLRSYRDYGSDCSRILTVYVSGLSAVTFIINSDV